MTYPDGQTRTYGGGDPADAADGDEVQFRLIFREPLDLGKVRSSPLVSLGEAYMDGAIDIEGDLRDVFEVGIGLMEESEVLRGNRDGVLDRFLRRQKSADEREQAEGVRHHYDLGNDFFRLWLDETMSYSCAYFHSPEDSLHQAQLQKIDHSLRKLQLREGDRLLDIGSGWGHLILRAAQEYGACARGITLSEEQVRETRKRIRETGLDDRVEMVLADYRELAKDDTRYDAIVSIGMFEHVGKDHIPEYFESVHQMLRPGGLSLLHTLTHPREDPSNPWLEKYIFPWGYIPSVREVVWQLPEFDFHLLDVESLRLHYAMTTDRWAESFERVADQVRDRYGERFVRMWRLFLTGCTVSFLHTGLDIHQFLFSSGLNNELPLTRQYMYPAT
ncbi:MAG: cyclopropane-fatty-acyl-phospholipid synthase family protein [Bacillota bacterium]